MIKTFKKGKDLIDLFPCDWQEVFRSWQNVSYVVLSVFALDMQKMTILVVLLIMDTFFGTIKAITLNGIRSLSGSRFLYGMLKKTLFILIPFVLSIIAQGVAVKDVAKVEVWLSIVIVTLILQQAYSVIANILSVLKNEDIRSKDFVSVMLERIMQILDLVANKIKDKLDEVFK